MKTSVFLAGLLAAGASQSLAVHIPFQRRAGRGVSMSRTGPPVINGGDFLYETIVTVAGKSLTVQLDTASSDFWTFEDVGVGATDIGPVNVSYAVGQASGNVSFAPFHLGHYKVESQAFINNADAPELEERFSLAGCSGMLGLAFDSTSIINIQVILQTGNDTRGRSPVSNIFASNPSLPRTASYLFTRTDDGEQIAGGSFMIGEEVEGYEDVLKAPRLPRSPSFGTFATWTLWVDGVTFNGTSQTLNSRIKDAPKGKMLSLMDSGSTYVLVPTSLAKELYGNFPGSFIEPSLGVWIVPCMSASNVSFELGGQFLPVHPLDLTMVMPSVAADGTEFTYCQGSFAPSDPPLEQAEFTGEISLGDAFMRNVYSSFNFGNDSLVRFDNGSVQDVVDKNPFIQLLTLTDQDKAWTEFFYVRNETLRKSPPEPSLDKIRQYLDDVMTA